LAKTESEQFEELLKKLNSEAVKDLRTTEEIRAEFIDQAQISQMDAADTFARRESNFAGYGGMLIGGVGGTLADPYLWLIAIGCVCLFKKIKFIIPAAILGLFIKYLTLDMPWHKEIGVSVGAMYAFTQTLGMLLAVFICMLYTKVRNKRKISTKTKDN
jgi:hypothetical protein